MITRIDTETSVMYESLRGTNLWNPSRLRFKAINVGRAFMLVSLAVNIAITAYLAVIGKYNLRAFTFWSFTILTAFNAVALLALFIQRGWLIVTMLFFMPLFVGNAMLVCIAIIILIYNNPMLYTGNTIPPGQLHVGDWTVHGWPVLDSLLILLVCFEYFGRFILVKQLKRWKETPIDVWAYFVYWLFGPRKTQPRK